MFPQEIKNRSSQHWISFQRDLAAELFYADSFGPSMHEQLASILSEALCMQCINETGCRGDKILLPQIPKVLKT